MIARVLCILLAGAGTAGATGWLVTPPPGWIEDAAAGAKMRDQIKSGFFQPERTDVEGAIYHAADDPEAKLVVQVVHAEVAGETAQQALESWSRRLAKSAPRYRTDGDDAVAELDLASERYPAHMTLRARRAGGLMHLLLVACSEPAGKPSCPAVFSSVRVAGEPPAAGAPWTRYLAFVGVVALLVGLVGWRVELHRKRPR